MKIKWFTYLILTYLIMASTWWTVLLFKKNQSEYAIKKELFEYQPSGSLESISEEYQRQKRMIIGEGLFLGITLLSGMWLIYRSHLKELKIIKQQNNFLLAITHELKSPVSSLDLIFQTLLSRKLDSSKSSHLLDTGKIELNRLEKMIDNLLLSAKNDQNFSSEFAIHALSEIILDLLGQITIQNPSSNIAYSNNIDTECHIMCDSKFLVIALKNIVDNAIKYCSEGDINIVTKSEGHYCKIEISDQGKGIPDKEKTQVFKKFYRIGNELIRQEKGSGLGLYITKKILTEHKGKIRLSDNKPQGTIFSVFIPQINE